MFQNFQKYPYFKTTRFKDIRKEENPTSKRRRAGNSQNISGPKITPLVKCKRPYGK